MEPIKRFLFWLIDGTRGGPTRLRLLSMLLERPRNLHQLSLASTLDYSTVEHHIRLMEKHSIVDCTGTGYGRLYSVSDMPDIQLYLKERLSGDYNENNPQKGRIRKGRPR